MSLFGSVKPFLEVDDLRVRRGDVEVVHGTSLRVFGGTIASLLGRNGAGKSSTLLAIAGLARSSGAVAFGGRRMDRLSSAKRARWGLVYAGLGRGVVDDLTVRENLELGAWVRRDRYAIRADVDSMFEQFPDLARSAATRAGALDAAERQFLSLGRALMAKPRMLLLDEPSAGLSPERVAEMFAIVAQINARGVPILLAEQYERLALAISDSAYLMERGSVVKHGVARQMTLEPEIEDAHLGPAAP